MGRASGQIAGGRTNWWLDVVVGMTIVWLGCMALEAMATATLVREAETTDHDLAQAIAQGERRRVELMPYAAIEPTAGFEAPAWIHDRSLEPGQVSVLSQPLDEQSSERRLVYDVRWKVENVDEGGTIRRITISVEWLRALDEPGRIVLTSLRAGEPAA